VSRGCLDYGGVVDPVREGELAVLQKGRHD
jgi:hypothetical protein